LDKEFIGKKAKVSVFIKGAGGERKPVKRFGPKRNEYFKM
jgi:hypothetical protein